MKREVCFRGMPSMSSLQCELLLPRTQSCDLARRSEQTQNSRRTRSVEFAVRNGPGSRKYQTAPKYPGMCRLQGETRQRLSPHSAAPSILDKLLTTWSDLPAVLLL